VVKENPREEAAGEVDASNFEEIDDQLLNPARRNLRLYLLLFVAMLCMFQANSEQCFDTVLRISSLIGL